jgi:hypothetical protein
MSSLLHNTLTSPCSQFGNMLVLSAAYYNKDLNSLVRTERLKKLLKRTIHFLQDLAPISPTSKLDCGILEELYWLAFGVSQHASAIDDNDE